MNGPTALVQLKLKDGFKEVLYAGRILKYNKQHKSSDRALLISDAAVYKLDGKNFKAMKGKIPFSEVYYLKLIFKNGKIHLILFIDNGTKRQFGG